LKNISQIPLSKCENKKLLKPPTRFAWLKKQSILTPMPNLKAKLVEVVHAAATIIPAPHLKTNAGIPPEKMTRQGH